MFRRKSTWQKIGEPVGKAVSHGPVRSGLTAAGTAIGVTLASAVVSAIRQRKERE